MASRVHLRSGSANSLDNRAFREAISKMRQEVLETKAETQSVRDQLNCLIMLVRRSWMGDQAATAHVANIVGAAPPTFLREDEKEEVKDIKQSRAVHHWAMLSIGLLNRHLRQLEKQALSKSKQRLQERQDFLDYQLTRHRDLLRQAGSRGLVSAKKTANPYLEAQRQPMVGTGRPKSSRPGIPLAHPLFDHPTKQQVLATNMVQHLANTAQVEKEHDLFSASYMVPDRSKAKRPASGTQKLKDGQRSRPKSAIVSTTKVERPLKYETTRPISGKPSSLDRKRAKSAKASSNPIFEMTQGGATSFNIHQRKDLLQNHELSLYDKTQDEDGLSNVTGRQVQMNGGHSHYIDSVTEGLRQMESMEEDFKRTTKMLQQKLGISGEGAI